MSVLTKTLHSQKGFTLVELLVAVAILAIVTASFLGLYYTGVFGIVSAGRRSTNIHLSQEEMERALQVGTLTEDPLTITMPDGAVLEVDGEIMEITHDNVTLRTFVPKK